MVDITQEIKEMPYKALVSIVEELYNCDPALEYYLGMALDELDYRNGKLTVWLNNQ